MSLPTPHLCNSNQMVWEESVQPPNCHKMESISSRASRRPGLMWSSTVNYSDKKIIIIFWKMVQVYKWLGRWSPTCVCMHFKVQVLSSVRNSGVDIFLLDLERNKCWDKALHSLITFKNAAFRTLQIQSVCRTQFPTSFLVVPLITSPNLCLPAKPKQQPMIY